jgi:hypothetical protein
MLTQVSTTIQWSHQQRTWRCNMQISLYSIPGFYRILNPNYGVLLYGVDAYFPLIDNDYCENYKLPNFYK